MDAGTLPSLPSGSSVKKYRIDAAIGSGGFGEVYRATDEHGRKVALKVARQPASAMSARELAWQQNEIELLQRLRHPSVVEVLDYGVLDDGRLFFAMELVEGELLSDYCARRGRLETLEALLLVRKLAEALSYCHDRDVLHLDLKPSNIKLIDPLEPRIKILDFGLARVAAPWQSAGGVIAGTPAFMPPEALGASPPAPSASFDVYSLGVIFYRLLLGTLPFPSTGLSQVMSQKTRTDGPPVHTHANEVPAAVAALIDSLLRRDPAQRLASAGQLAQRLRSLSFEVLEGRPDSQLAAERDRAATIYPPILPGLDPAQPSGPAPRAPADPSGRSDLPRPSHAAPWGADARVSPVFVGRRTELDTLLAAVDAVVAGEPRSRMVVGDAGLGKSALVAEVLRQARHKLVVGYGRCRRLGNLVPYSPLREALGDLAACLHHAGARSPIRAAVAEMLAGEGMILTLLVPEMAELLPPGVKLTGEARASLLLRPGADLVGRAVRYFLSLFSAARPVALVLEDLHWADAGTLEIVANLVAERTGDHLLLLVTSRPSDRLDRLGIEKLPLSPLDGADNRALVESLLGGASRALFAELASAIPVLRSGHPLLVTRIIRNLQLDGYLTRGPDGTVALTRPIEDYSAPDSASDVLGQTVERLDAATRAVLGAAALIDRQFQVADLAALGLFQQAEVDVAIASGERQLLLWTSGARAMFAHDTIREQLERSVDPARLADLHSRIGERLMTRGAAPGTIAYHLDRAGRAYQAASLYVDASIDAERLHDPSLAKRHLRRALDLLLTLGADAHRDALLLHVGHHMARVGCVLGDTVEVIQNLDRSTAAVESKSAEQLLALNSAYARVYYVQGNFPKAVEYSSRCLALPLEGQRQRAYQSIPLNIIGRAQCSSGKFGPAVSALSTAVELAKEAGDDVELCHSEGLLSVALGFTGAFEESAARAASSMRAAEQLRDPVRKLGAHFYWAVHGETRFDWDLGVRQTTQLLNYADEQSIGGLYLYVGTVFAGRHQFHLGRLERARLLLENALHLAGLFKIAMGVGWAHAFLGDAALVAGDHAAARASYARALEVGNAGAKDEYAAPLGLIGLAHAGHLLGAERGEVAAWADEALARFTKVSNRTALVTALQRYAEVLDARGDAEAAAAMRARRAALLDELHLPSSVDFWPRIPEEDQGAAGAGAREYWASWPSHRALASGGGPAPQVDTSTTVKRSHDEPRLMKELSSIARYVPEFVAQRS